MNKNPAPSGIFILGYHLTADEKHAFTQRLLLALKRRKKKIDGPAALALQFNLRHHKESITPQAAYKWLHGIALPAPDKIATLAEWLDVSSHWLRFGPPDAAKAADANRAMDGGGALETLSTEEKKLLARLRGMSEHQRYLVRELVEKYIVGVFLYPLLPKSFHITMMKMNQSEKRENHDANRYQSAHRACATVFG